MTTFPHDYMEKFSKEWVGFWSEVSGKEPSTMRTLLIHEGSYPHGRQFLLGFKVDIIEVTEVQARIAENKKYDLVIGNLFTPDSIRSSALVADAIDSSSLVSDTGIAFYVLNDFSESSINGEVRKRLTLNGLFVNALAKLGGYLGELLTEHSPCLPLFLIASKKDLQLEQIIELDGSEEDLGLTHKYDVNSDTFFVSVINDICYGHRFRNEKNIHFNNYKKNKILDQFNGDINVGLTYAPKGFKGFHHWLVNQKISSMDTDYCCFTETNLRNVVAGIWTEDSLDNTYELFCGEELFEVVIPRSLDLECFSVSQDIQDGHEINYFIIGCDRKKIIPKYLLIFLNSQIGQALLESLQLEYGVRFRQNGSSLQKPQRLLQRQEIEELRLFLPSLKVQEELCDKYNMLEKIKKEVIAIDRDFSIFPHSVVSHIVLEKISDKFSEGLLMQISKGESQTIEFKETLSWDTRTKKKEKWLEDVVIKTIFGFLNTHGGRLLIGISDDKEIIGISEEIDKLYKSSDKLLLHLQNILKSNFEGQENTLIKPEIIVLEDKQILQINCLKSKHPVFFKEKDFYIRTNPATEKLEGKKLANYLTTQFY